MQPLLNLCHYFALLVNHVGVEQRLALPLFCLLIIPADYPQSLNALSVVFVYGS